MGSDKIYFPAYFLETKKYKVFSGSKYWNKSKTGSSRYETELEAQNHCDELNKVNLKDWNP